MKKATTKSYALRIEAPLVKPLQELKKQNRRSLNAEINAALEAWVAGAHRQTATAEVAPPTKSDEPPQPETAPSQPRARKQSKRKSADAPAEAEATHELTPAPESATSGSSSAWLTHVPVPEHTHGDD
jgi:hypothetical protein